MLPAREAMLKDALAEVEEPVSIFVEGSAGALAAADLLALTRLQPLLRVERHAFQGEPWLPRDRYPLYRLAPAGQPALARAGFVGFPEGFMLDALCDVAVALSRGDAPASPLARETLEHLEARVEAHVLTTPG